MAVHPGAAGCLPWLAPHVNVLFVAPGEILISKATWEPISRVLWGDYIFHTVTLIVIKQQFHFVPSTLYINTNFRLNSWVFFFFYVLNWTVKMLQLWCPLRRLEHTKANYFKVPRLHTIKSEKRKDHYLQCEEASPEDKSQKSSKRFFLFSCVAQCKHEWAAAGPKTLSPFPLQTAWKMSWSWPPSGIGLRPWSCWKPRANLPRKSSRFCTEDSRM